MAWLPRFIIASIISPPRSVSAEKAKPSVEISGTCNMPKR
jgi:hypothetical protein